MTDQAPPTLPAEPVNAGQHATWIAGRAQTLLSHYFSPDLSPEVVEAAIDDWVKALVGFPKQAIEFACEGYLRDQPRRRPTPGDIASRAGGFELKQARARSDRQEASDGARRAVEWAGITGRIQRTEAWEVLAEPDPEWPDWLPGDDAHRAVYKLRQSGRMVTPDEGGVAAYRKMVRT